MVTRIVDDTGTPFAVVVHFVADQDRSIESASTFEELTKICDQFRDSDNLFYAVKREKNLLQCLRREDLLEGLEEIIGRLLDIMA